MDVSIPLVRILLDLSSIELSIVTATTPCSFRWTVILGTNDAGTNGSQYDGNVCLGNARNDDGPQHADAILFPV